jgi:hypothetical protein
MVARTKQLRRGGFVHIILRVRLSWALVKMMFLFSAKWAEGWVFGDA